MTSVGQWPVVHAKMAISTLAELRNNNLEKANNGVDELLEWRNAAVTIYLQKICKTYSQGG
jgi:hypothetical protein